LRYDLSMKDAVRTYQQFLKRYFPKRYEEEERRRRMEEFDKNPSEAARKLVEDSLRRAGIRPQED